MLADDLIGIVPEDEWDLTGMDPARRQRLLSAPPQPMELIETTVREAMNAAHGRATLCYEPGDLMKGCERALAVIPIERATFDALFNGPSGYRAQYYRSVEAGARFNRLIVDGLLKAIRAAYDFAPIRKSWADLERSFQGPWSKIWVRGDTAPFKDAPCDEFRPKRWAENPSVWLKAPLPAEPALDVKGTWVRATDGRYEEDPFKAGRHCDLFRCGGA